MQGPQGYLWLATYDDLVRFDGVEFAEMSGGNSALPTSRIAKVHHGPLASDVLSVRVAGDSALWLRTERTIYRRRESEPGRSESGWSESGGGEAGWTAVMPDTTTAQVMRTGEGGGLWVGTEQQGLWRVRGGTARPVAARTPSGRPVRRTDALAVHDGPAGRSVRVASGTRLFRLEEGRFTPLPSAAQPL